MLKIKISGYYRSGKNNVDFEDEIVMPKCKESYLQSNVMYRILPMHFATAEKPFTAQGRCWIDNVTEDVRLKPSYAGKSIKELDWTGIEEVAIAYCLSRVPLYRDCSIREAREILYKEFAKAELGANYDEDPNFNFMDARDFVFEDFKVPAKKETAAQKAKKEAPQQQLEQTLESEFAGEEGQAE